MSSGLGDAKDSDQLHVLGFLRKAISCQTRRNEGPTIIEYDLLGLYFSASWCPPCKALTPILRDGYGQIRVEHGDRALQVVLIPLDTQELAWEEYIKGMPWLTLNPSIHREAIVKLFLHYQVTEAPRLIITDHHGQVVVENARGTPGRGFGYGCDPLLAYDHLVETARVKFPKRRFSAELDGSNKALSKEPSARSRRGGDAESGGHARQQLGAQGGSAPHHQGGTTSSASTANP